MKEKALILGALPFPFEGPWIRLDDAQAWEYEPEVDYDERVVLETKDLKQFGPNKQEYALDGERVTIMNTKGLYARAVIRKEVPDVELVTIKLKAKRI